MSTALAIFVKTPGHSPVKTRLARAIGNAAAIAFHERAARAVCAAASAVGAPLQPCWAVAEVAAMDDPRWRGLPRIAQGEGSLGTRMHHVYTTLRRTHERVFLTGADVPQQSPTLLRQACAALDAPQTAFALGETVDGGFWLFGGRVAVPRKVWCSVSYSQPDTAACFRKALRPLGPIASLPTLADVDQGDDLPILEKALARLPTPLPAQHALLDWLRRLLADAAASSTSPLLR